MNKTDNIHYQKDLIRVAAQAAVNGDIDTLDDCENKVRDWLIDPEECRALLEMIEAYKELMEMAEIV